MQHAVFDDIGSRSQGMVPSSSRSASNAQNESRNPKSRSVHVVETMLRQFFSPTRQYNTLAVMAFIISHETRRIAAANMTAFTAKEEKYENRSVLRYGSPPGPTMPPE
ncbi:hypothetical protein RB213_014101 [Colletotrichum asianum]